LVTRRLGEIEVSGDVEQTWTGNDSAYLLEGRRLGTLYKGAVGMVPQRPYGMDIFRRRLGRLKRGMMGRWSGGKAKR
jgi:hypothetical protein